MWRLFRLISQAEFALLAWWPAKKPMAGNGGAGATFEVYTARLKVIACNHGDWKAIETSYMVHEILKKGVVESGVTWKGLTKTVDCHYPLFEIMNSPHEAILGMIHVSALQGIEAVICVIQLIFCPLPKFISQFHIP
jgi:hypothetical protein